MMCGSIIAKSLVNSFFWVNCEQIRFDIAVSMIEAKPVITPSQHHLLNLENLLLLTTGHLPDNTCMKFES